MLILGFPGGPVSKESACNVGDLGLIPWLGRSPGGGQGNPPQYSCLENVPWIEEPGGLQSMGSQRAGHDQGNLAYMLADTWVHTTALYSTEII